MERPSSARRDGLALILAAAAWAGGTVISKRALDDVSPFALLPIQLAASVLALSVALRVARPAADPPPAALLRLGLLNPGLAYALSLIGLTSITASESVLLWAVEPVLIALLAAWLLREQLTPWLVAGSAAAFVGVAILVGGPGTPSGAIGLALTLAGVACCAIYSVAARGRLKVSDGTAEVVLGQQVWALALAVVLVAGAALLGVPLLHRVSAEGLLSAIASGVLYYAVAYWFYLGALARVPASIAAGAFYLIPLFGIAFGSVVLGERLQATQWLGGLVLLAGMATIGVAAMRPRTPTGARVG